MNIDVKNESIQDHHTEALVVGMFEGELSSELQALDKQLSGALAHASSEPKKMKLFYNPSGNAKRILVVGLGKEEECTREMLRRVAASAAKRIRAEECTAFSTNLHTCSAKDASKEEVAAAVAEGIILGLYEFKKYKTIDTDKITEVKEIVLLGEEGCKAAVDRAMTLAHTTNYVRDLVNEPPMVATPTRLAKEAKALESDNTTVTVFGKKEIEEKKMGGLMNVSRGSSEEPQFIIIDYKGADEDPLVFVGKGITFDSGGINLKPTGHIEDMKCDMAGAATVLGTVKAVQALGLKRHVIAVIATCENMTGAHAYKPGDILTAYNGKTIEVWNTDAEGRLVLADALSYTEKELKPQAIVDIATLTGASLIALGHEIVSLMATDDALKEKMLAASKVTDERMWELPMIDDYKDLMKGEIGDVRNTSTERYGPGTITAGIFLSNFVEKTPWVHLDIGASGWMPKDTDYKKKGGTGVCLRTFVTLCEQW